ncbi:MAG: Ig domain-containing protein [Clostridiaceae bacterium]|nr:Ig domain-containing protein [Clostridiaceae bacterium]
MSGPRIELLHAVFEGGDRIVLTFKEDITETIDTGNIKLNESIGAPSAVYRDDADYKRLIMEFDSLDTSDEIPGNKLMRGAVLSRQHGRVSIWYNGVVEGEFTIYHAPPVPVTGLTIDDGDNLNIEVGQSLNLTATISPNNATDKTIIWSSSDPDIVSVDDDGLITGVDVGGPVVIKATSANNSGAYDEIDINVIPTEEMAFAELDALLDSINELTVRGPTNTSPVIEAPADSDGVTYRLTSASPTSGTPRIVINATGKEATVTRHSSSNREGQIRLRASKYGYSRESDAFTVTIPRNRTSGRGAVTVYK